jgi:hypothetical protein
MIAAENITTQHISKILKSAALDTRLLDDTVLLVQGFVLNITMEWDEGPRLLRYRSSFPLIPQLEDLSLLRFVNDCNRSKIMVQHTIDAEMAYLQANFVLSLHDGLNRTRILRHLWLFMQIFEAAVEHGRDLGLIEGKDPDHIPSQAQPLLN